MSHRASLQVTKSQASRCALLCMLLMLVVEAAPAFAQGDVFSSGSGSRNPYGSGNTTNRTGKQAQQDDSVYCQQTPDGRVIPKPYGGTRRNIPCGPNFVRQPQTRRQPNTERQPDSQRDSPNDSARQPEDSNSPCDTVTQGDVPTNSATTAVSQKTYLAAAADGAPRAAASSQCIEIRLTSVAWISSRGMPFRNVGDQFSMPAGALLVDPQWLVKTYIGLYATSNPDPLGPVTDVDAFRKTRAYRGLLHTRIRLRWPQPTVASTRIVEPILDPGYTPPFDLRKVPSGIVPGAIDRAGDLFGLGRCNNAMFDQTWYSGELSPRSKIATGRLPGSTLTIPAGEQVLASGMIKFRAGEHTDNIGVRCVDAPFHVPWVWNEFALTVQGNRLIAHVAASTFPTTAWFVNGRELRRNAQASDSTLATNGRLGNANGQPAVSFNYLNSLRQLDLSKLRVYPTLAVGAPVAQYPKQPSDSSNAATQITSQPFTAPSAGQRSVQVRPK